MISHTFGIMYELFLQIANRREDTCCRYIGYINNDLSSPFGPYWQSDMRKIPDLLHFIVPKVVNNNYTDITSSIDLSPDNSQDSFRISADVF